MLAIQAGIGALNDAADAVSDFAARRPHKPIPAGLVSERAARRIAWAALALGLVLTVPSGPGPTAVAALGAGLGVAYDLRLSRRRLAPLPLALALPLVPLHAWWGAVGTIPIELFRLVPAAVLAGAALALANALGDSPGAGVRRPAWWLDAACLGAALLLSRPDDPTGLRWWSGAALLALAGLALTARPPTRRPQLGWEVQALAVAAAGLGLVIGLLDGQS